MNNFPVEKFKQERGIFLSIVIVEEIVVIGLCDEKNQRNKIRIHSQYVCAHQKRAKCGTKRGHEIKR